MVHISGRIGGDGANRGKDVSVRRALDQETGFISRAIPPAEHHLAAVEFSTGGQFARRCWNGGRHHRRYAGGGGGGRLPPLENTDAIKKGSDGVRTSGGG